MLHKKSIILVSIVFFLIISSVMVAANATVDQRSVLAGRVISLPAIGSAVHEGDVLVRVHTLTGSIPAARATANGVVTEVFVRNDDLIKIGDIVARIQVGK